MTSVFNVAFPAAVGLVFLLLAVLYLKRGATAIRNEIAWAEQNPLRGLLPKRLRLPLRLWPERYDGLAAVASGIVGLLMALMFFAIAVSVAVD
ncbi:MAG: hypothetical protein Q8Q00_04295 [Dehalococcoidia bacterium]|nr:hypothetical protein [Dehalococcoidia bacterium]